MLKDKITEDSANNCGDVVTQCGNLMIFLQIRFYVKSILKILESQKLPLSQMYEL